MESIDFSKQLDLIQQFSFYNFWGYFLIIIGTVILTIYKRKRGGNYKLVVILGVGLFILYGLVSGIVGSYLVSPIYNLGN